jgi:hypothetical protein
MRLKGIAFTLSFVFICSILLSSAYSESYLYVEERITALYNKIEAGAARGSLTKNEQGRLKSRLFVVKHKSDKYKKQGTTTAQYLQLERELVGIEKDTDRLLKSLKRR